MMDLRREVAIRRVIKTMDEVPPELLSEDTRKYLGDIVERTHLSAAQAVKAAVDLGVTYSEINRNKNLEAGIDEDAPPPADADDPCPDDPDDEPKH